MKLASNKLMLNWLILNVSNDKKAKIKINLSKNENLAFSILRK
jgi:hypothetical protein